MIEGLSDTVRIRLRAANVEAEIECEFSHLKEAIELLPEVARRLNESLSQAGPGRETIKQIEYTSNVQHEIPVVKIEKGDSLTDIIEKFFSNQWGSGKRKLSDVIDALRSYALNYPKQSVAVALLRLAKAGKIRRFKAEDGEYVYTAPSPWSSKEALIP